MSQCRPCIILPTLNCDLQCWIRWANVECHRTLSHVKFTQCSDAANAVQIARRIVPLEKSAHIHAQMQLQAHAQCHRRLVWSVCLSPAKLWSEWYEPGGKCGAGWFIFQNQTPGAVARSQRRRTFHFISANKLRQTLLISTVTLVREWNHHTRTLIRVTHWSNCLLNLYENVRRLQWCRLLHGNISSALPHFVSVLLFSEYLIKLKQKQELYALILLLHYHWNY